MKNKMGIEMHIDIENSSHAMLKIQLKCQCGIAFGDPTVKPI